MEFEPKRNNFHSSISIRTCYLQNDDIYYLGLNMLAYDGQNYCQMVPLRGLLHEESQFTVYLYCVIGIFKMKCNSI